MSSFMRVLFSCSFPGASLFLPAVLTTLVTKAMPKSLLNKRIEAFQENQTPSSQLGNPRFDSLIGQFRLIVFYLPDPLELPSQTALELVNYVHL